MSPVTIPAGSDLFVQEYGEVGRELRCLACGFRFRRSTFGKMNHGRREVRAERAREMYGRFVLTVDVEVKS